MTVECLEKEAGRNAYAISLGEPGDSTPIDRTYEAAIAAANDAEIYRAEWKEQSLHNAIGKYLEASRKWQSIDYRQEAAQALSNIGDVYSMLSKYDLARQSYEKALAIRRSLGDRAGEIEALNDIGCALIYQGDNEKALELLTEALHSAEATASEPQNNRRMAQALNNIGEAHYAVGDLPKAFDYFNRALALWTTAGDRAGQALAHINLGYSFYDSRRYPKSIQSLSTSTIISRGDRRSPRRSSGANGYRRCLLISG